MSNYSETTPLNPTVDGNEGHGKVANKRRYYNCQLSQVQESGESGEFEPTPSKALLPKQSSTTAIVPADQFADEEEEIGRCVRGIGSARSGRRQGGRWPYHREYTVRIAETRHATFMGLGFLLLTPTIPLAMIAIGATHFNNCPAIPELPALLIAAGSVLAFGTLGNIADVLLEGYLYHTSDRRKSAVITVFNIAIFITLIICLILGCMWVYGRPEPAEFPTEEQGQYCHPVVYQVTFWLLNIMTVIVVLIVSLSIIAFVTDAMSSAQQLPHIVNA